MIALALSVLLSTPSFPPPARQDDAPPQPILTVDGDEHQRYLLHAPAKKTKVPKKGWKLLVVMPGGNGNAEFAPFVGRIRENVFDDEWLVAQIVAPVWTESQAKANVWPTTGTMPGCARERTTSTRSRRGSRWPLGGHRSCGATHAGSAHSEARSLPCESGGDRSGWRRRPMVRSPGCSYPGRCIA